MAATKAVIGLGATFGVKSGSSYVSPAEITRVTPPGWTRNTVDATHLESPDGWAEFIGGLKTGSDCTFDVNWVPAVTDPLLQAFDASVGDFRIGFPGGKVAMDFRGVVTDVKLGEISPEGKLSASVTIKPSGKPALVALPGTGG